MGAKRDFTVIVPAFNEAAVMPDLVRELREAFTTHGLAGEVILVDDGSTDATATIAEEAAEGWQEFKVVRHATNLGKTEAMLTGAAASNGDRIVLFDADLQHSPDEIPRFLDKLDEGWDIVAGRKIGSYDKRAVSSVYNRLSRRIFDVPVSDLNSMKAFRRSVLDGILLRHDWHRFFIVLAHARGARVAEIDIDLLPRRAGESKFRGPFRILVGLIDLISVWFLLLFSRKPLLLFGATGLSARGTRGPGHGGDGVSALRPPDDRLRSVRSADGIPAAALLGDAAGDLGLLAGRVRSRVGAGSTGARRARSDP